MYFRFGRPDAALKVFDHMPHRNTASWNTVISGCVRVGRADQAIDLFRDMRKEGIFPNGFVLASLFTACNRCKELVGQGIWIHGLVLKVGLMNDVFVATALLHLYGSYSASDAQRFFDEMPERNVVSWTALMVGCSKNGHPDEAVRAYRRMRREGVVCNQNSFSTVISSCGLLESKTLGLQVVAHAVVCGFGRDVCVANSVIALLDSLERIGDAEMIFNCMESRDTISWNSMISMYSRGGMLMESLKHFSEMRHADVRRDATTFSSLISACSCVDHLKWGRCLHSLAVKDGLISSTSVCNTLVTMYSMSGRSEEAELLFSEMPERDLISWNSMISSYAESGQYISALKVLGQMLGQKEEVNHVSFASALAACLSPEYLIDGKMIHALIIHLRLCENLLLCNALITMYSKCNAMREAEWILQTMPEHDLVTWNALIGGHVENEEQTNAIRVFNSMRENGLRANYITMVNILGACSAPQYLLQYGMPLHAHVISNGFESDEFIKNSLLTMYSKCGDFDSSKYIFDCLASKSAASWNAMINSKAHHGHGEDGLKLFTKMRRDGVDVDQFSLSGGLAASTSLASLEEGQQLHGLIIKLGFNSDLQVNNAAMDMYGKCGSMDDMLKILPEPSNRSRQSWNIIISGYARHGYFDKAEETLSEMLRTGLKPDYVTFVSLLSACSHAGLADKGLDYFTSMTVDFGISPRIEHCVCIVDLLGRCGRLMEAERFIEDMPVSPNDLIWRSLLASSRIHKNAEIGRKAAERLFQLNPLDDSAYVLLSNVCATSGRWEDVDKLRTHMKSIKLKKRPACSWIKVKNEVSSFGSGDRSHAQAEQIYFKLEEMLQMVKELGYVADTSFILHDIDEEQKEHNLWSHSEKIALAYGLLNVAKGNTIRVFKNLRVCGDCHLVFKLVSEGVGREIVLRDPYRFHHFKDGECSCSDYW